MVYFPVTKPYNPSPLDFKVDIAYPFAFTSYPLRKPIGWGDMIYLLLDNMDTTHQDAFTIQLGEAIEFMVDIGVTNKIEVCSFSTVHSCYW